MLAVLDKTEIIIYESNIFFRLFGKFPKLFQEIFFRKINITILIVFNSNFTFISHCFQDRGFSANWK